MKRIVAGLLAVGLMSAQVAEAAACAGNACNEVTVGFTNGCWVIRNVGGRTVSMKWGQFGGTIAPGGALVLINPFSKTCVPIVVGNLVVNH